MAGGVAFSLDVDGSPASAELLRAITRVEVEDHADMADMLRLRLGVRVRDDGSGWTVLDDGTFTRLAHLRLAVTIGRRDAMPLIDAYVIETDARLASDPGVSTLGVVAMDPTVLLHLDERVRAWPNMTDSDVASAIFSDGDYRFTPVVEDTKWTRSEEDHTLMQRGTDMQFLARLAERNGYEVFVELNADSGEVEGHFHPPRHDEEPQGTLTVNMGAGTNVRHFRARFDMLGPAVASGATLDVEDASDQTGEAERGEQEGMGDEPATPAERPRTVLLGGLAMGNAGEVQRLAQAVVDRSAWSVVAEGELDPLAYGGVLRAKRPVLVRGAGRDFSGTWYVERVLHVFGAAGAYTQRFTLRRNALGVTGQESFGPGSAA